MIEAYAAAPVRVQLEKVERSIHNEGFKAELQTVLSYGGLANIRQTPQGGPAKAQHLIVYQCLMMSVKYEYMP